MAKSAEFDQLVQGTPRFRVPADVVRMLEVGPGDDIHLTVTQQGRLRLRGTYTLRSGLEIYGPDVRKNITPRSRIHVIARA